MPAYRWTCHKCREVNDRGVASCTFCGFPAVASGSEIALEDGSPANEGRRRPISEPCPCCKASIEVPSRFFENDLFRCRHCGATLSSNHTLRLVVFFILWVPLVAISYHYWPMFTFFVGDWLLGILVALCVWPFFPLKVLGGSTKKAKA